jgi:ubiquinone/menaquinone biosynthesis C-methylase UbiE
VTSTFERINIMDSGKKDLYKSGEYTKYFAPERKDFPFADTYEEKKNLIVERLASGGRKILDLGGGRGRISLPLSIRNRVVMADLSMKMIEEAIDREVPGDRTDGSIEYICCDAENPPFLKESFDVLLAIDLLPHVKDIGGCLQGCFDLIRPGGEAVIDNSNSVPFWMFAYPEYVDWKRHPVKFVRTFMHGGVLPNWADRITHLTKDAFVSHLRSAGFIIVDFVELGPSYCPKWHLAFCRKPSP